MMKKTTGRIVRSLSGFYDVQTDKGVITCRGRGHLRRGEQIPLTLPDPTPAEIAVNEALELARAYSTPEAVSFVNGVLGSLLRSK